MRCIETLHIDSAIVLSNMINYNMRCIETYQKGISTQTGRDKLQHEMY